MEKELLLKRVRELLHSHNDRVVKKVHDLYELGAVDPSMYPLGYVLPKILITSALRDCAESFAPVGEEYKEVLKNLEHF